MSNLCWFDGTGHHVASTNEKDYFDLDLSELENRMIQLDQEKVDLEGISKWITTVRAPLVRALKIYPAKKHQGRSKENFDTIFRKVIFRDDCTLRLDLGILCCILFTPGKVDEIFDKQNLLNLYFDKHNPDVHIPPWAAERAMLAMAKIPNTKDDKLEAKRSQLTQVLQQTSPQTAKPSKVPPASPSTEIDQTTLGNGGSENIDGGSHGFDRILQDQEREARRPHTDQSPAFAQSLPPIHNFLGSSPPSNSPLQHQHSQGSNHYMQAVSNLQPTRQEFTIEDEGGRRWPDNSQFSMNKVQEPHQPLNSNLPPRTVPAATSSQLKSRADPFRNSTQEDIGNATTRRKRHKVDNLSQNIASGQNAGQVSSAPTWQSTTVGGQGQYQIQTQAQALNVQAALYSGSDSTPPTAFGQDFNLNYMGNLSDWMVEPYTSS